MSLIAFAVCLIVGGLSAGNGFGTAVGRALLAMVGTLIVGLIVGTMAQKMLDENVQTRQARLAEQGPPPGGQETATEKPTDSGSGGR
jgi:uncharacterized protein YcfJ